MEDIFYHNPSNDVVYCPVCDKSFGKKSQKGHVGSKKHHKNLEKALKKVKAQEEEFNNT
jgi:hypothetical protein